MRRADRLLHIVQVLRRHRSPVTGEQIAQELEVSTRTLYRDIVSLQANGVPIRGEAGVGYVLDEGYDLPPLMFTSDELEAVMMGLRLVGERGDATLQRAAQDVIGKVAAVLPAEARDYFTDAPLYAVDTCVIPTPDCVVSLDDVRAAMRGQNKLRICYRDAAEAYSERVVWPITLAFFTSTQVMVGWCELRQAFRVFRVDRIMAMDVLNERYRENRVALRNRWWQEEETREEQDADCSA